MATWKKIIVSGSSAQLAALKVDNLKKVGNSEDQSMITIQQTDIDIDEIQDRLDLLEESIQELKLPITNEEQYKIVSFYFLISIYIS